MSSRTLYRPRVITIGDSLMNGIAAAPTAGFRQSLYFQCKALGMPIWLIGDPAYANGGNGPVPSVAGALGIDPYTSGAPGTYLGFNIVDSSSGFEPDITMLGAGTNNVTFGQDAATILGLMSNDLDATYRNMRASWKQIVRMQLFKRQDAGDVVCQQVNAGLPALVASKSYSSIVTITQNYGLVPDADYVDTVHFNGAGCDIVGNAIAPQIVELGRKVQASAAIG